MPHPIVRPVPRFALRLAAALTCAVSAFADTPPTNPETHLKDETRLPWTRSNDRFIRRWQVLSELPLAASADAFAQDPFAAAGGEAVLRPGAAPAPKLPDGTAPTWRAVSAWGDPVDLSDGNGLKRNLVAYAATTVTRAAAGKALLSLGSDESLRVWVNGALVLDRRGPRPLTPDEDQVEVDLQAGDNLLLVKVEQRTGPWNFTARVLETGAIAPRAQEIGPSFREESPAVLVVKTDLNGDHAAEPPVAVQVVAAGGKVLAEQTAARGATVRFDTAAWPDGPCELRFVTTRPNGLRYATHQPWFKGDALAAARTLVAAAAKADVSTPAGQTVKMLGDLVLDRLGKDGLALTGNPWWAIHAPLMEFAELQQEAAGGASARARSYGFYRLAWRDDVDGSPQFARAYLPGGYDAAKPWPVVIALHGYNPANPDYVRWWGVDGRHSRADVEYAGRQGVIVIEPHGRGNTQYLGLGDADILRVLREAKAHFNVDEDRVYLCGESMGGWGTWNVGTRHPDLFAAIAPIFGGVDYHSELAEEQLGALTPLTRFFHEKQSSWALAEDLLHVPILVLHGDVDQAVNVDWSRYGVRLLQRWGYNVRYDEMPGYAHEDLNRFPKIIDWFLEHRRVASPRQVRLHTAELQHAAAYWVAVEQAERPDQFMVVDAEIVSPATIRLDSQNVLALTLTPGAALVDGAHPVKVVWNGVAQTLTPQDGRLVLRAPGFVPAAAMKNSLIAGPLSDVFNTPFAVVTGTVSADPAMNEIGRQKADNLAAMWQAWQRQPLRRFTDTELSDADAARYSLILIGGPEANLVARRFADRLPLAFAADHVTLGGRSYAARDASAQAIFPHPLNPARYVVVAGATSAAGLRLWSSAALREAAFDFLIDDGHIANLGQKTDPTDLRVVSGWFDHAWRLDDRFLHAGLAAAREQSLVLLGAIEAKRLAACVGRYQIDQGPTLQVSLTGSRLDAKVGEQPPVELLPAGNDRFYVAEGPALVVFEQDASGRSVSFKVEQNGHTYGGKRVD